MNEFKKYYKRENFVTPQQPPADLLPEVIVEYRDEDGFHYTKPCKDIVWSHVDYYRVDLTANNFIYLGGHCSMVDSDAILDVIIDNDIYYNTSAEHLMSYAYHILAFRHSDIYDTL